MKGVSEIIVWLILLALHCIDLVLEHLFEAEWEFDWWLGRFFGFGWFLNLYVWEGIQLASLGVSVFYFLTRLFAFLARFQIPLAASL